MLPWRFGGLLLELPLAQHANGITFLAVFMACTVPTTSAPMMAAESSSRKMTRRNLGNHTEAAGGWRFKLMPASPFGGILPVATTQASDDPPSDCAK